MDYHCMGAENLSNTANRKISQNEINFLILHTGVQLYVCPTFENVLAVLSSSPLKTNLAMGKIARLPITGMTSSLH